MTIAGFLWSLPVGAACAYLAVYAQQYLAASFVFAANLLGFIEYGVRYGS